MTVVYGQIIAVMVLVIQLTCSILIDTHVTMTTKAHNADNDNGIRNK